MAPRSFIYKPPVEAVEGAAPSRRGAVARSVAIAALVSLMLGSKPLLNWTNELPISPASDLLLTLAQRWDDASAHAGLTRYGEAIRYWLQSFEGARFNSTAAADIEDRDRPPARP